jgi:hypothetical protein
MGFAHTFHPDNVAFTTKGYEFARDVSGNATGDGALSRALEPKAGTGAELRNPEDR